LRAQIQSVDQHSNLEGVILDANGKQVDELFVSNLFLLGGNKFLIIVFFAVHFKNDVNIVCCDEKSLSVVLGFSVLDRATGDNDLFVVSLVVLSVRGRFDGESLGVKHFEVKLCGVL
tara:strand:+ start:456 stop:806 length:351 start_codon:yes stop_codon:yes gene_type:complete